MPALELKILTILADNEFGVLTQITALIRREGWNIRSLTVSETQNKSVSRFTITVSCLQSSLTRVTKRLTRLNCVRELSLDSPETHLLRELVLLRVTTGRLDESRQCAEAFGAKLITSGDTSYYQLVDLQEKISQFVKSMEQFGIEDVVRSGVLALLKDGCKNNV